MSQALQHRGSSYRRVAKVAAAVSLVALAACKTTSDAGDAAPAPVEASAAPPRAVVAVEPSVKRYPDEAPLNAVHAQATKACVVLSAAMDPGVWVVETLPAGWKVTELAQHGEYTLVQWKPTGRGLHLSGWLRGDCLGKETDPVADAGACGDAAAPYGNLPCARECWAETACAKPSRCIRTEPGEQLNDVVGLCIDPEGRVLQ